MKQKIVINVQMPCPKSRTKAMKIAAKQDGVTKVEVQGSEKDQLVVIGDGVDPVKLTCSLRKDLRVAKILSVEEEKEKKEEKEKEKEKDPILIPEWPSMSYWGSHPQCCYEVVCEPKPTCSIM